MTDLNKEREAFEEFFRKTFGAHSSQFSFDDYGFYDDRETLIAWTVWQEKAKAQAVPEGYVLLPRVPTEKMLQAYERYSVAPMSTLSKTGYKAMVEAAGDQNENS
ncbi:hypothetical protein ACT436_06385 [Acinetobacter baumannii]